MYAPEVGRGEDPAQVPRPEARRTDPLVRSGLATDQDEGDPVAGLRDVLADAVDGLAEDPRTEPMRAGRRRRRAGS